MNKLKHVAIAISALSVMSVASLSFADCPTTISPSTATCLSKEADATFQSNYNVDYANQGGSGVGSSAEPDNGANVVSSAPQQAMPSVPNANNNDNNNSNDKSSIRWF